MVFFKTGTLNCARLMAPALQNTNKIPREDRQERVERMNIVAGEGKKARNFGPSGRGESRGGPAEGSPGWGGGGFQSWRGGSGGRAVQAEEGGLGRGVVGGRSWRVVLWRRGG